MLKIKEECPYIILPKQKYGISKCEPHTVMSYDFTLFIDFNLDSTEFPKHYAIVVRPGMHMGIVIKTISANLSCLGWDFWTHSEGNYNWNTVQIDLTTSNDNLTNDRYFVFLQHNSYEKKFSLIVKSHKSGNIYKEEVIYNDDLVDYSGTPYNIGCGNFNTVVPDKDRWRTSLTLYNMGLISNNRYNLSDIYNFIEETKNDTTQLSKELHDLVFYFNCNEQNIYKVWDLSGNFNFLEKNTFIDDEC